MIRIHLVIMILLLSYKVSSQLDIRANINKARNDIFDNKNKEAIERLNKVIKFKPDYYHAYFFRAIAKFELKDYKGAIEDFSDVIRINPFMPDAYHFRGMALHAVEDYNNALNDYDKAAQLDINNPDIYIRRGLTKIVIKNFSSAVEDFNKAIGLNRANVEVYIYRAVAKAGLKDYSSAIDDCNMALQYNQFSHEAFLRRGLIKYEQENIQEAIDDFNKSIKLKPDNAYAYYVRALAKNKMEDFEGTMADYNKVIELNPYNALAYYNRAMLKEKLGQVNESIADLGKVIELNPTHLLSYFNRGIMYSDLKYYNEALIDFTKAIELYPEFAEAYYMRSLTKRNLGLMKSAEKDYKIAMQKMEAQNNDTTIAIINAKKYQKVIELDADFNTGLMGSDKIYSVYSGIDPLPEYSLLMQKEKSSLILFNDNKPKDFTVFDNTFLNIDNQEDTSINYTSILNIVNSGLSKDSTNYQYWYINGIANAQLQNYNVAIEAFTKSIKLKPNFIFARIERAKTRLEMYEFINSIDPGIKISDNDKDNQVIEKTESFYDYSEIIEDYNRSIELNPDLAFVYFNRANIKVKSRDYEGAFFDYNRAIKLEPDFADAYYNLSLLLIHQQKISQACTALSKAGELGQQKAYLVIQRYCKK